MATSKEDLVQQVAKKTGLSRAESHRAIESLLQTVSEELVREEKVTLTGFGSFTVVERRTRRGCNPQTGEVIQIPARKAVKFSTGKQLKQIIS